MWDSVNWVWSFKRNRNGRFTLSSHLHAYISPHPICRRIHRISWPRNEIFQMHRLATQKLAWVQFGKCQLNLASGLIERCLLDKNNLIKLSDNWRSLSLHSVVLCFVGIGISAFATTVADKVHMNFVQLKINYRPK